MRIRLINDIYPAYADCSLDAKPAVQLMSYINRRYDLGLKDFVVADFTTRARRPAQLADVLLPELGHRPAAWPRARRPTKSAAFSSMAAC